MTKSLVIGVYCADFDTAKIFYTNYLDFDVDLDEVISYGSSSFRRLVLIHQLLPIFKIEFYKPSNDLEFSLVGKSGGTTNLFTLPSVRFNEVYELLKTTPSFIDIAEAPYGRFLNLRDPMGNHICLNNLVDGE